MTGSPSPSTPGAMTAWHEIVAAALVGTERRPLPDRALASLEHDGVRFPDLAATAEARVLAAAALLGPYRSAGWQAPALDRPVPPAAEPEVAPAASGAALSLLDLLLSGQAGGGGPAGNGSPRSGAVVIEWLERCATSGHRVPPLALPRLLDLASVHRELQRHVAPVVGTTGRWLAERHPAWAWLSTTAAVTAEAAAEIWRTGTTAQRQEALRTLREHDPAAGLAMLQSTWRSESASDRAVFVGELVAQLGEDDEPFCESCLDDRSSHVRRAAVAALQRLPASGFADRMTARAVPLVSLKGRVHRRLAVELADEPDEAARRDIVLGPRKGDSRTRDTLAILAGTPLRKWEQRFAMKPPELVRRAHDEDLLIAGWRLAAMAQHNAEWARALLEQEWLWGLARVLPGQERVHEAARACADDSVPDDKLAEILQEIAAPWPEALTGALLERARRRSKELRRPAGARRAAAGLTTILRPASRGMAPEAAPLVEAWLRETGANTAAARDLLHALILRQAIADAFRHPASTTPPDPAEEAT